MVRHMGVEVLFFEIFLSFCISMFIEKKIAYFDDLESCQNPQQKNKFTSCFILSLWRGSFVKRRKKGWGGARGGGEDVSGSLI